MRSNLLRRSSLGVVAALLCLEGVVRGAVNALPEKFALPATRADTTKPGFLWNYHQVADIEPNSIDWAEDQLAGMKGVNLADPSAAGIADAPSAAPASSLDPIGFSISSVNNLDRAGGFSGGFVPDDQMPGCPGLNGSSDNAAAEILFWLELPAGAVTLGCNSDDGFRWQIGGVAPRDRIGAQTLGSFEGTRPASDTLMSVLTTKAGLYPARVVWENGSGGSSIELFSVGSDGRRVLLNDTAHGGLRTFRTVTGTLPTYASFLQPAKGATAAPFDTPIRITLVGANVQNDASLILKLDGTKVAATKTQKNGVTDVRYQPPTFFLPKSVHTVELDFNDGSPQVLVWSFTVQNYGLLSADMRVTPDTSKPGFKLRTFNNQAERRNDNQVTDDALNGLLTDAAGAPLANLSDSEAVGAALDVATRESAAPNATLVWNLPGVINLSVAGGNAGAFTPDDVMPGNPAVDGSTVGARAEFVGYVTLKKGITTLGVNSDDGFRATAGPIQDAVSRVLLGSFNGTRTARDSRFRFVAAEDGTYPVRITWENGGGAGSLEVFTLAADGTRTLINDTTSANGLKAYRAALGTPIVNPYVKTISPYDGAIDQMSAPTISAVLVDAVRRVDKASVKLSVQGQDVSPTVTQSGGVTTVSYQVPVDFEPRTQVAVSLVFRDNLGASRTVAWSFTTSFVGRDTLFVEAEDFDFDHGQSVTNAPVGMTGPYAGGAFKNRGTAADLGFDYNAGGNLGLAYRPETLVAAGDQNGPAGRTRGYFLVNDSWTVTGNEPGEWYNYSRYFPTNGHYQIFLHAASGGDPIDWTVDLVTAGAGTDAQSLRRLGVVHPGRGTAGWDAFEVFQATDESKGNQVAVAAIPAGWQTIRLTLRSGAGDLDYLAFNPVVVDEEPGATPALSVNWDGAKYTVTSDVAFPAGFRLQTASSLDGPWVDAPLTLPYTSVPTEVTRFFRVYSP